MLQNSHGMSIPALVPPCFEEPGYGINTSVSRPPFSICQPHVTGSNGIAPSARVLQEVMFPNEMNYPSYMPDIPSNQGLALPWVSSWHQRQNLQYLGHPHPGKIIVSIFFTTGIKPHSDLFWVEWLPFTKDMLVSFGALQELIDLFKLDMLFNCCRDFICVIRTS